MSEPSHLIWHAESVAELRAPGRLRQLGIALESEPLLRFTKGGRTFPPKRRIPKGAADLLEAYEGRLNDREPEMWLFARDEEPVADLDILVADDARVAEGTPHALNGRYWTPEWFSSSDRVDKLSHYLTRVADAAGAFYAYCTLSELEDQRINLLKRNGETWVGRLLRTGRVIEDLERELPDVYWWNYFGPAYVRRWQGKLDGLGVRQERTDAGARVIWATETPFVLDGRISRLEGYTWKKRFYEALGPDTFMREGQTQRAAGEVVPDLNAHRSAAGGVAVKSRSGPKARERILPRIVPLPELSTEEAAIEEARDELIGGEAFELELRAERALSVGDVLQWLRRRADRAVGEESLQGGLIVYRHPDTAVTAGFDIENRGLRFRLPWPRPTFFALETMPLLADLVREFHVSLPREGSTVGQLIELWKEGNEEAVRASAEPPPYMDPQRSDRWWRYQSRKEDLHQRLGEDVFVPTLVGVGPSRKTDDLRLHITWTDAIPLVIPECDLVTLLEGRRPSEFKVRGTVEYQAVRKGLEPYLESISVERVGTVALLSPKRAKEARRVFLELPTGPFDYIEVGPAEWVDVARPNRKVNG